LRLAVIFATDDVQSLHRGTSLEWLFPRTCGR
jgi:hypothetical protein